MLLPVYPRPRSWLSLPVIAALAAVALASGNGAVVLKPHAAPILYGVNATKVEGAAERSRAGDFLRCTGDFALSWTVTAPAAGDYDVHINYAAAEVLLPRSLVLTCGASRIETPLPATRGYFAEPTRNYERVVQPGTLRVSPAESHATVVLTVSLPEEKARIDFRSLELVPIAAGPAIETEIARAVAARARPEWFSEAAYGAMFHWTSQSVMPDGTNKPFANAVQDFDVPAFVDSVDSMGFGYVLFTIGHAEPYCPAPIATWEKYHPGHTTSRDLVVELADQLGTKGIKLLLYFPTHILAKTGQAEFDEFTRINHEVMEEFGERYGRKVAGYWFDGWYQSFQAYPDVDFEAFYRVCRTGNPERIIALNSWIYPSVTPWQDYWAGEVGSPVALPNDGGTFDYGPAPGLPYQALLTMEPYWVQQKAAVPPPKFTPEVLGNYIRAVHQRGGLVTINLGIHQDGTVGAEALAVMRAVRRTIRR